MLEKVPPDLAPQDPALVLTMTLAALTSTGAAWDGCSGPASHLCCRPSVPMLEASGLMVTLYRTDFA